jgi:hypothetical protein
MHSRRGIRSINHSAPPPDGLLVLGRLIAGAFLLSPLFAQLPRVERSDLVQYDIGKRHLQIGPGYLHLSFAQLQRAERSDLVQYDICKSHLQIGLGPGSAVIGVFVQ